jgi:RNA polymerase sigma-70 factor (ECF subfamily)
MISGNWLIVSCQLATAHAWLIDDRLPTGDHCPILDTPEGNPCTMPGMVSGQSNPRSDRSQNDPFQTTHWSLVVQAADRGSLESTAALEALCRTYWRPLYHYVRRRTANIDEADDLTQEFFARLLEKNYLAAANPDRGKFRAFLLTAFKHFLANEWEKARAQKRGGGKPAIPLDFNAARTRNVLEPATGLTPEETYDREWATTVLAGVFESLEGEFARDEKGDEFNLLKGFLTGDHPDRSYAEAARELGSSEAAVKMAVHRLKGRFRERLREHIAATVAGPEEIDAEIRALFTAFAG